MFTHQRYFSILWPLKVFTVFGFTHDVHTALVLNRTYLRVQEHSSFLAGHIRAGDGCPPTLHDGQLYILLQTLETEQQHSSINLSV